MRKQSWTKRDPIKNYFPLPNENYDLGLSRGAISVYSFLLRREDRRTYQCLLSYREIGEGVGMSHVSSRTIISIEKEQYSPSLMLAYRLALVFGVTVEEVCCLAENKSMEDAVYENL